MRAARRVSLFLLGILLVGREGAAGARADEAPAAAPDSSALLRQAREARAKGAIDAARALAEQAIAVASDDAGRRDALRVWLTIELSTGRLHSAARRLPALRALEASLGNPNGVAACDVQTAAVDASLGRLLSALARIEDAVAWLDAHGAAWERRGAHLNAARIRLELGDAVRAREHLERAREFGRGLGLDDAPLHLMDGALALREGREEVAATSFLAALAASKVPGAPTELSARLGLVVAYVARRRIDDARAELARVREATGTAPSLGSVQADAAECLLRLETGDAEGAVKVGLAARARGEGLPGGWVALVEERLARASLAAGDPRSALEASERASEALLHSAGNLPDVVGARYRAERADPAAAGLDAAAVLGDVTAMFRVAERGHGIALRARLHAGALVERRIDPAAVEEGARLAEAETLALAAYRLRLTAGVAEETRAAFETMRAARERADRHRERLRTKDAVAAQLLAPEGVSLDEARAGLRVGDALVVYAAGLERLRAIVVTKDEARAVELGARREVDALLARIVPEDRASPVEEGVAALRAALATPLRLPATTTRIVLVAAGPLGGTPFAALWPEVTIVRVPSVTTGRLLAARARTDRTAVLAAAGAPLGPDRPLPGAEAEVKAVGTPSLVGEAATEAAVRTVAAQGPWRAIHLAGHALVDPGAPTRSAIAFRPGGGEDGLWTVSEMLGDGVRADLVVLSACSTATGRRFGADGEVGFPHAFFVAGARSVLGSLWDVDDEATRALMSRFYEAWRPGVEPADALRRAQASLRKEPRFAHPAFWAAWQVWGGG